MNDTKLEGICCDVSNCVYNDGQHCCTANHIDVQCRGECPDETMCGTFREV